MKKVFLALTVIGLVSLTSCDDKKSTDKESVETTETTPGTTEEPAVETEVETTATATVEVPKFSNADVQKFANEYGEFYSEMIAAAKSGDQAKMTELQGKAVEWAQKSQEFTQKMTAEDMKLWTDWAQKLATAAAGQ